MIIIKNNRYKKQITTISIIIAILSFSCASDRSLVKKQAEAFRELGAAYMMQGDYGNALAKLLQASKLDSDDPLIYNYLGLVFMAKEKYENAIYCFKEAILIKSDFSIGKNNLGAAYCAMKNWDKAVEIFSEATKDMLYPTPHYPLSNIGWAYFNKKDYSNAEKFYLAALKIAPDFPIALNGLAQVYITTEKYEKAERLFQKIRKLDSGTPIAKESLNR